MKSPSAKEHRGGRQPAGKGCRKHGKQPAGKADGEQDADDDDVAADAGWTQFSSSLPMLVSSGAAATTPVLTLMIDKPKAKTTTAPAAPPAIMPTSGELFAQLPGSMTGTKTRGKATVLSFKHFLT